MYGYGLFVSYRRSDVPDVAKEIADACIARLGVDKVFFDRSALQPGDHWSSELIVAAQMCDVMLVIIGPNWLGETPKQLKNKLLKRNRLWDENDYVQREIKAAYLDSESEYSIIIPVLVGDARLPQKKELPMFVDNMLESQVFHLSMHNRAEDIETLVNYIEKKIPEIESENRQYTKDKSFFAIIAILFVVLLGYGVYWVASTFFF